MLITRDYVSYDDVIGIMMKPVIDLVYKFLILATIGTIMGTKRHIEKILYNENFMKIEPKRYKKYGTTKVQVFVH